MIRQPSSTFPILVRTVVAYTANDPEVATTVPYLVKSGKVRLGRIFAAARFDQSTTNISEFHLPPNGTNELARRRVRRLSSEEKTERCSYHALSGPLSGGFPLVSVKNFYPPPSWPKV